MLGPALLKNNKISMSVELIEETDGDLIKKTYMKGRETELSVNYYETLSDALNENPIIWKIRH